MDEAHGGNGSGGEAGEWVAIVANPYSGSRRNPALVEELTAALRRHGLSSRPIWSPEELASLHQAPGGWDGCRCVVAAGGDGTVARTVNLRVPAPLAVLPLGNENLFARQFGFTRDAAALARRIAAGRTASLDLGRCGDRWFSVVATAGFDAEVIHRLARWRQHRKGVRRVRRGSYFWPITAGVVSYRYPAVELVAADGQRARGALAVVANLPRYAMSLNPLPEACGTDGLLDWVVFKRPGLLSLAGYSLAAWRGRHLDRSDVHHGRARWVELRSAGDGPVPLEIDGDAAGHVGGCPREEAGGHGSDDAAGAQQAAGGTGTATALEAAGVGQEASAGVRFEVEPGVQRIIAPVDGGETG